MVSLRLPLEVIELFQQVQERESERVGTRLSQAQIFEILVRKYGFED